MLPAAAPGLAVFTAAFSADVAHMVTAALLLVAGADETGAALALVAAAVGVLAAAAPPVLWLAVSHSASWLASAAGMAVLEKGGNAFDAAVAAGLVLQVVEPHLNGPGGEVPIIGYDAGQGEVFVLDGQGPAPQAATPEAFAALGLDLVPGSGLLAACVPAAFGTWMLLLAAH